MANEDSSLNTDLEEVIVFGELPEAPSQFGASKSATPILGTSRSISIETIEDYLNRGAMTLGDVLEYTSGVDSNTYGSATRVDSFRIRGFQSQEYRDGQQIRFGFYNNSRTDIYMLERVEILKGPASVRYGKGSPGGLVNMVSKLAGRGKINNDFSFDAGTQNRLQLAGDINFQLADELYFRLVGVYRDADHFVDVVKDDALIVMPSLAWQNDQTKVTLMFEYQDRESDTSSQFLPLTGTGCVDGSVSISPAAICRNADGRRIKSSTYHGEPGFNRFNAISTNYTAFGSHELSDNLSIDGVLRRQEGEVDYWQGWIDFKGAGIPRVDSDGQSTRTLYRSDADSEQTAADVRLRYTFATGNLDHEVFFGAVYQDVTTSNANLYLRNQDTIDPYNPTYDGVPPRFLSAANLGSSNPSTSKDYGLYINNQISFGDWKFNIGLRYDEAETKTSRTKQKDTESSFSVGTLYAFNNGISPYISYAESFEPVIGTDMVTNNPLKPKIGEQWEGGIKYQPSEKTRITLAYFRSKESNLPNPSALIGSPNSQQEGIGTSRGFELEAFKQFGDWQIETNLTLLDTKNANGVKFDSVTEDKFSAWVQYQPVAGAWQNVTAGLGVRYLGDNESNANVGKANHVRVITEGVTLFDAMLSYQMDVWKFAINARNLTDKDYYGTCLARGDCFPGAGRSVVGRVSLSF